MVAPLTINEKMHLTIPIYGGPDGETIIAWIHSTPISRETFEAHFLLLGKTFAAIHAGGLGMVAGPRVASLLLAKVAEQNRDEMGALSLMNEIRRLTNVVIRGGAGWETMPFQDVLDRAALDLDDLAEVTNAIVFFIVTCAMQQKRDRREMMDGAARLWGARTSSLGFTAFVASLTTWTETENTQPVAVSSGPY